MDSLKNEALRKQLNNLCENITLLNQLTVVLLSMGSLVQGEVDFILEQGTPYSQNYKLLAILMKKPDKSWESLLVALKQSGNCSLAECLENEYELLQVQLGERTDNDTNCYNQQQQDQDSYVNVSAPVLDVEQRESTVLQIINHVAGVSSNQTIIGSTVSIINNQQPPLPPPEQSQQLVPATETVVISFPRINLKTELKKFKIKI